MTSLVSPGASVISVVIAAQGSRPGPARPDSPPRLRAAGGENERGCPRNSRRAAGAEGPRAPRPDRPPRLRAAGVETEPCSPRNSVRSAVTDWISEPEAAKAIFFAKSPAHAFRANIAPLSGSHSQTTWSGAFSRTVPRTHSAQYVADKRRGRSP